MDIRKLQRAIVDGLEDVKAQNIVVFNTEALSPLFERVIIASGTSNRQTKALAASVRDAVKAIGQPAPRTEGEENGEWIIVDCGAAVAHIMQPAIRDYYHLEEIWGVKPVALKSAARKAKAAMDKAAASSREAVPAAAPARPAAAASRAPASPTRRKTSAPAGAAGGTAAKATRQPAAKKAAAKTVSASAGRTAARAAGTAAGKTVGSARATSTAASGRSRAAPARSTATRPARKAAAKKTG